MKPIFKGIVGSQAYGTSTPQSDIDYKGVYIQPLEAHLTFNYKEQVEVNKDETYYELKRFLQLAQSANPTILEMFYLPPECVLVNSLEWEYLQSMRDNFLTKKCLNSFGGYAVAQIKKAKGLNKKMNWEQSEIQKKDLLDFCYIHLYKETSAPFKEYFELDSFNIMSKWSLTSVNHFPHVYQMYYYPSEGICFPQSNSLRTHNIPKGLQPRELLRFDADGYSTYCKKYNEYQTWLRERNTNRYVDTPTHKQKIDGKNLMHCIRLIDTAKEIALNKTINVKRPNADYLLQIRRGEFNLEEVIEKAELDLKELNTLYLNSDLPEECNIEFINQTILDTRKLCL